VSENVFDQLDEYVSQVASRLQDFEAENAELRKRIDDLQEELEGLKRESLAKGQDIENYKHERLELRSRVKRIRENIATLEARESAL
jgi:cell division septum initiation protein DivIVA